MGAVEWTGVIVSVIGVVFGLIGWLLSNKDKKQEEEIVELFRLHKEDSTRLQSLELDIAKTTTPSMKYLGCSTISNFT